MIPLLFIELESQPTSWKSRVKMVVAWGVISGSTANVLSPTRPRVALSNADSLTGRCSLGATRTRGVSLVLKLMFRGIVLFLTFYEHPVRKGVKRPDVGCPISMT